MINTILFLLSLVGLTIIMSTGQIFERPRNFIATKSKFLGELVSCPMCLGFWVGLISALAFNSSPMIFAGIVSLLSWTVYNVVDLISTCSAYITNLIMIQGQQYGQTNEDSNGGEG